MKKLAVLFFFVLFATASFAQFQSTNNTLGVVVGFGGGGLQGEGAIPIGAEYMFYSLNEKLNLGVYAGFASTSEDVNVFIYKGTWTYTNILIAASGNYHFSPGEKFDPFVGASLGYNVASASFEKSGTWPAGFPEPTASVGGLVYSGHAGFNYWMSPGWAVQVRVGLLPYVGAGVIFNM